MGLSHGVEWDPEVSVLSVAGDDHLGGSDFDIQRPGGNVEIVHFFSGENEKIVQNPAEIILNNYIILYYIIIDICHTSNTLPSCKTNFLPALPSTFGTPLSVPASALVAFAGTSSVLGMGMCPGVRSFS